MKKAILFLLLLTMTACAYVDPTINDSIKVYTDTAVRKSSLQVAVHPKSKQYRPLTAYFHPFVIQQQNSDYFQLSNAFAEIFNNAWLEERLFTIQEFQSGTPYQGLDAALDRARRRGADLLILGYVPYFYAGHTVDDTAITIKLNVYAAGNGALLWSMVQSGRIESKNPDDYIYFTHEHRLSTAPFTKIIRSIAKDMAIPLKGWLPDPDKKFQFAKSARDVEANLTTPEAAMTGAGENDAKKMPSDNDLPSDDKMQDKGNKDSDESVRPDVKGVNLDIQFEFNKASIDPKSYALVDAVGEALNSPELKGKKIIIAGHADQRGTDAYNLKLSKNRADSVKQYLVNKWGVDPALVETVGYGKSRPLNQGSTAEDMRMNRRVELRLSE
ncbi:OmpA family protein [Pseudodesulfovibrio sp. zrk46]|uniref:OmpA family protein n=1 Tax=Pseudodesulfovibrio sp. zrk46 TaxID=2725288 RepID=UPI00144914D3|nr:OmpA family protein [Pseudodesulfovibrio sp. zrk46]QJB58126.1 OmpA family protein [Pseudodesulfovibrio sp. zrk46]